MKIYISLLRGINVSGQKKILMKDLKAMYESLHFENVQTYIQSGNVIFESKETNQQKLSDRIHNEIEQRFGFDVHVHTLTVSELKKVMDHNPYADQKIETLYIAFLSAVPENELLQKLNNANIGDDEFIVKDNIVYLHYKGSYGNSKLNNNFLESKLKLKATTRNVKTLNTLMELSS